MLVRLVGPGVVVVEQMIGVHPQSLILNPFARYSFSGLSLAAWRLSSETQNHCHLNFAKQTARDPTLHDV